MVTRVHRNTSGNDYTPKVISLGPITVTVESDSAVQKVEAVSSRLENDSEVMGEIADRMVLFVRENIQNGEFTPVLPETLARRRYPFLPAGGIGARMAVGGTKPLIASGALLDGIEPRSKKSGGYAAAQRGRDQWYGFLHNEGIGRFDRRTFMELKPGHLSEIVDVYDEYLTDVVEEDVN